MRGEPIADRSGQRVALALFAIALLVMIVRAQVGASLYDDTYYATTALRFAEGARPFAEEMSVQALGQLAAVPFIWVWHAAFDLTGIVLAVRLVYVGLAAATAIVLFRLLRPTFGPAGTAFAIAIPLLAPPYQLLAPTYNTVAILAFMLAVALGFAALRDDRRSLAAWAGVMAVAGSAAHPPMIVAAVAWAAGFALVARGRRLAGRMVAGGLGAAAVIALALFAPVSADDVRRALRFALESVGNPDAPLLRLAAHLGRTAIALVSPWHLPMWAFAVASSVPRMPRRLATASLAAIPVAATLPGFILLAGGDHFTFGTHAAAWLVTVTAALVVPAVLWARRSGRTDLLQLTAMTAGPAAAGVVAIAYITNSSFNRAMTVVALAPLAMCLLGSWWAVLSTSDARWLRAGASAGALTAVIVLLFATVWADEPITTPHVLVDRGPYAGLWVGRSRAAHLKAIESAGRRHVSSTDRVGFMGERQAYLLVGGTIHTNAVWLPPSPADVSVLEYYDEHGLPDVMFVDDAGVTKEGGYAVAPAKDPLLARVLERYAHVADVATFSVFRLR
jgi:hypothetical protein